jgi:GNAT superfamily N-acetyltransferase
MVSLLFTISTAEGGPVCWLEDMVVRPHQRGSGVGSLLLHHAIEHARGNGYRRITLLTDRVNAGAIRFYGRHGFRPSEMNVLRLHLEAGPENDSTDVGRPVVGDEMSLSCHRGDTPG